MLVATGDEGPGEKSLATLGEQIDNLRDALKGSSDPADKYNVEVKKHNDLVAKYNKAVADYNGKLGQKKPKKQERE